MVRAGDKSYYDIKNQCQRGLDMLVGHKFYFYGCHNNHFKIDDMVLEVLEDPEDGYRSCMGGVRHDLELSQDRFFKRPLARVVLQHFEGGSEAIQGWELKDMETGHQWLLFGTSNYDDYYPYFTFTYNPDQKQTTFPTIDHYYEPFKERYPEMLLKYPDWFAGESIEFGGY